MEDTKLVGLMPDIWNEIMNQTKTPYFYHFQTFAGCEAALIKKTTDAVVGGVFTTEFRAAVLGFKCVHARALPCGPPPRCLARQLGARAQRVC